MSTVERITDDYPLYGVGQHPGELEAMVALYRDRRPRRVLEIGTWYGGTLREWLRHAAPNAIVVAVDPEHRNPHLYAGWKRADTTLITVAARSEDSEMVIAGQGPYDWIFVDGDHSAQGVTRDVRIARAYAAPRALLLLHDITAENYPPTSPRQALEQFREQGFEVQEIVQPVPEWWPTENGHGIGIVRL